MPAHLEQSKTSFTDNRAPIYKISGGRQNRCLPLRCCTGGMHA